MYEYWQTVRVTLRSDGAPAFLGWIASGPVGLKDVPVYGRALLRAGSALAWLRERRLPHRRPGAAARAFAERAAMRTRLLGAPVVADGYGDVALARVCHLT